MAQQLEAQPISARTKGEVKRLRRQGLIPVSVQHKGQETLHLQGEAKPLDEFIRQHGESALLELTVSPDNGKHTVLVHDVQRDPLTHHLLQVTFQAVQRGDTIKVHVPLTFHGEPQAVHDKTAIVQHPIEQVEIHCRPQYLPTHITVDISHLAFGEALRVADLPHNDHYEILTPPDTVLASLSSLAAQLREEEPATTADETPAATEAPAPAE